MHNKASNVSYHTDGTFQL